PTNPLRVIEDTRFLLIPGVLQEFKKRKQKKVRDHSLIATGRIPIGRRFGECRSQSRRFHCRNIDRRNRGRKRFNRERFLRSRILSKRRDQCNQRQRHCQRADNLCHRNERLQVHTTWKHCVRKTKAKEALISNVRLSPWPLGLLSSQFLLLTSSYCSLAP